ncbi:hypothetical protein [Pseudomonas sp.]|uniref:hypothetical protein n=1 Tax=Pseudomonas sp. TaxID=306 RepID=UPI001B17173E|nr:hypothetical protein [Pseudomonas sp.]MBO9551031.1 hypothetical protein [Pseudomonas sp.]
MIPAKFKVLFENLQSKFEMDPPEISCAQQVKGEGVKWSKGPSFSIVPFGLELAGETPSPILDDEPNSKKIALSFIVLRPEDFIGQIYTV